MTSALAIGRSLRIQISIGSPSPRFDFGESWLTRRPQYVWGMKPYKVGGWDE
jgi:hypothetical protein